MAAVQARPAPQLAPPLVGHLREDANPGAHVLAELRIVRGRGRHFQRPRLEPPLVRRVKVAGRAAEPPGIAPHLGERDQNVVAVEGRVLDPLGLDRRRVLLELLGELYPPDVIGLVGRRMRIGRTGSAEVVALGQEHGPQEIEDGGLHRRIAVTRLPDRRVDHHAVGIGPALRPDVRAVHGEARHHFDQGFTEAEQREIPGPTAPLGHPIQAMSEHVQLARHGVLHDEPLALVGHVGEGIVPSREFLVEPSQRPLAARIDEQPVDLVEEVVAGRAVHHPGRRQPLVP